MVRARFESYGVPKAGHQDSEYEDASWPEQGGEGASSCLRFAVADGATESVFAGRWARLLAQAAGEGRIALPDPAVGLAALRAEWREWLAGQTLPWYAEETGSFAALVVLVLEDDSTRWQALALGDSCVIQVRENEIVTRFPLEASAEFDNRPQLIGSSVEATGSAAEAFRLSQGNWQAGDRFFLMTDALACWFLREAEQGGKPWQAVHVLPDAEAFSRWIAELRAASRLRNDDCTLLAIEVMPPLSREIDCD